jgi:hypothetical protein
MSARKICDKAPIVLLTALRLGDVARLTGDVPARTSEHVLTRIGVRRHLLSGRGIARRWWGFGIASPCQIAGSG